MSERVLAIRKVDDVLGTVRYRPDPDAPSVSEVVEVLRDARDYPIMDAENCEERGDYEEAKVHEHLCKRIDNLIARLGD